ncbi:MAG: rod shape-determining protein MreC [Acidimicrobiales bacterium]
MATDRSRRRTWTLTFAALFTVLVLYLTTGIASGLRSGANIIVTPFNWAVDTVARPIGHLLAGTINYSDVVAQNQKLRYELGIAEERVNQTWAYSRELQQLTTQLNVPFVGSLPTVAAQVTSISPTNFSATLNISKGRNSGILAGMPVVANGGLIGRIVATTASSATVRLITDPSSLVGVTFNNGTTTLIVSGRGVNNGLGANAVALSSAIQPGTKLSTDGLNGGLFPPGLPVATVKTVSLTPGATTYNLTLTPVANLRHISYLNVVLWEPTA